MGAQGERSAIELTALVARVARGERAAVARALRIMDDAPTQGRELAYLLQPHLHGARVVGITGNPGAGKSTVVDGLVTHLRTQGKRVGVLAVDPSSPYSGGAILGDRIRMARHATDEGVFIRSLATRGHLGGLSRATADSVRVLDAAGYDVVLIETVGVGQDEVDIARLAETSVVVMVPGLGDDVQAIKAGLLEIADVFLINKADRDGAADLERSLRQLLMLAPDDGRWEPPITRSIASRGEGLAELWAAAERHGEFLRGPSGRERAAERAEQVFNTLVDEALVLAGRTALGARLDEALTRVREGAADPYAAARALLLHP